MNVMRNIALIGKGYWGRNIARNLESLGRLGVIVDFNKAVAAASREEYPDVTCTSDLSVVLDNPDITAAFIATPAPTHADLAVACLEAGKDVFIEKPMCLTMADGRRVKEAARAADRSVMVGHILLYHPCVVKLKQLIESGGLGNIQYVYSNRLNFGKIRTNENIFWSFAPHDISVINYLLGENPCAVRAEGKGDVTVEVFDTTLSILDYPGGTKAHIFVSWLHPYKDQRLVIMGDKSMAVFSDTDPDKLVLYSHSVDWVDEVPVANKAEGVPIAYEQWEPLRRECEHFLECIAARTTPRTDVDNGLGVMEVLIASDRSIAQGGARIEL